MNEKTFLSADFENLEEKFSSSIHSSEFDELIRLFDKHNSIYVIGNGGLHYVASHMATDISRLVPGKYCHSFDSFGFITSSANDFGFDSIFERWLANCVDTSGPALLLGLSCSGTSKNIMQAFSFAQSIDWDCFLVTGKKPSLSVPYLTFNAKYFHTVETLSLMLFYEIIHRLDGNCPQI